MILKKCWYNEGSTNQVDVKVNPDRVQFRNLTSQTHNLMKQKKDLNVIVATMSITIAFSTQISAKSKMEFYRRNNKIESIKRKSRFCFMSFNYKIIFKDTINNIGNSKKALAIQYFESLLGNKLTLNEIPLRTLFLVLKEYQALLIIKQ